MTFKTNQNRYDERNHRSGKVITPVTYEEKDVVDKYGHVQVSVQDQFTPLLILPMAQQLGLTALAVDAVIDNYIVSVVSSAGMTIGDHFRIINSLADRFYSGTILNINLNDLTLDTPIDFAYLAGSEVTYSNINMAVDGSVTPVYFNLRTGSPSIPSSVDITRMLMVCECDSAVDLNKFGNLPALTRGLVFRTENEAIRNIWNIKANKGLAGIAYDWTPYSASNPAQAVDGFAWRLTFNGQNKIGVTIRVEQDGQLTIIVQDDLTDLVSLICILEGHVVE